MRTFYINLDSRADRQAFMEAQFATLGIAAQRIAATTPAEIDPESLARHCNRANKNWIDPAELAVSFSHRKAWRAMLDEDLPCALILEDDVYLSSSLPTFLEDIKRDGAGLDLIRIETRYRTVCLSASVASTKHGVKLHRPLSFEWGCAGYVITAACARKLLAVEEWFVMPVDNMMFDPASSVFAALKIRQTVPGLCADGAAIDKSETGLWKSNIHDGRSTRYQVDKPPVARGKKLPRELRRIGRQIRGLQVVIYNYLFLGARWRTIPFRR
jgi:glycosyl transferase family 25